MESKNIWFCTKRREQREGKGALLSHGNGGEISIFFIYDEYEYFDHSFPLFACRKITIDSPRYFTSHYRWALCLQSTMDLVSFPPSSINRSLEPSSHACTMPASIKHLPLFEGYRIFIGVGWDLGGVVNGKERQIYWFRIKSDRE